MRWFRANLQTSGTLLTTLRNGSVSWKWIPGFTRIRMVVQLIQWQRTFTVSVKRCSFVCWYLRLKFHRKCMSAAVCSRACWVQTVSWPIVLSLEFAQTTCLATSCPCPTSVQDRLPSALSRCRWTVMKLSPRTSPLHHTCHHSDGTGRSTASPDPIAVTNCSSLTVTTTFQ